MPLTRPAVSETNLELSVLNLFEEWLLTFFHATNPTTHAIGGNANVSFPPAQLRFQQDNVTQPLNGAAISLVWENPARVSKSWQEVDGTTQEMAYARTTFTFWIRAAMASTVNDNAKQRCARVAALLYAILGNSNAARPLSQKGIHRLRPMPPRAIASSDFQLRLLVCEATLRYPILSQVPA